MRTYNARMKKTPRALLLAAVCAAAAPLHAGALATSYWGIEMPKD